MHPSKSNLILKNALHWPNSIYSPTVHRQGVYSEIQVEEAGSSRKLKHQFLTLNRGRDDRNDLANMVCMHKGSLF